MNNRPSVTQAKRTRASGPKVRTGCLTCKSRHVKCDERKPECIRCASTGRKCEGYLNTDRHNPNSPDGSNGSQVSPLSAGPAQAMSLFGNQSPKELRSIELFFIKAAPQLSGYFQEPFWNFVLQVSFDEPSIRHALVAVSAVYEEDCLVWETPMSSNSALKKLSLDYYNRSIRSMVKKMQDKDSIIVPVIGCLLFVCLEFLKRDIWAAIKHIDGGIKIIEQARARRRLNGESAKIDHTTSPSPPEFEIDLVERVLAPLFSSLNITASVFGRPGVYFFTRNHEPGLSSTINGPMQNMEQAVVTLLNLCNESTKFIHEVARKKHTAGVFDLNDYLAQDRLLKLFEEWREKFDALKEDPGETWFNTTSRGKNMLRAVHLTTRLWLTTSCTAYETAWDAYKPKFEVLLTLIEDVIQDHHRFPNAQSKLFSFELGIIPPLELVARKCRYPKLRRRALELLRTCPKRECLFDSFYSSILDERVMQLEEMDLKLPPGQIPDDDQLPPEHSRIHLVFFAYEEVPGLKGWPVSFLSKPNGNNEDWFIRKELLDIEGSFLKVKPLISPFSEFSTSIGPHVGPRPYDLDKIKSQAIPPKKSIAVTADA